MILKFYDISKNRTLDQRLVEMWCLYSARVLECFLRIFTFDPYCTPLQYRNYFVGFYYFSSFFFPPPPPSPSPLIWRIKILYVYLVELLDVPFGSFGYSLQYLLHIPQRVKTSKHCNPFSQSLLT